MLWRRELVALRRKTPRKAHSDLVPALILVEVLLGGGAGGEAEEAVHESARYCLGALSGECDDHLSEGVHGGGAESVLHALGDDEVERHVHRGGQASNRPPHIRVNRRLDLCK